MVFSTLEKMIIAGGILASTFFFVRGTHYTHSVGNYPRADKYYTISNQINSHLRNSDIIDQKYLDSLKTELDYALSDSETQNQIAERQELLKQMTNSDKKLYLSLMSTLGLVVGSMYWRTRKEDENTNQTNT